MVSSGFLAPAANAAAGAFIILQQLSTSIPKIIWILFACRITIKIGNSTSLKEMENAGTH
jgi:hypothetical protein